MTERLGVRLARGEVLAAPVIEPILARASNDPEEFLRDLSSVYLELNLDVLTERLTRVLFGSRFVGSVDREVVRVGLDGGRGVSAPLR